MKVLVGEKKNDEGKMEQVYATIPNEPKKVSDFPAAAQFKIVDEPFDLEAKAAGLVAVITPDGKKFHVIDDRKKSEKPAPAATKPATN